MVLSRGYRSPSRGRHVVTEMAKGLYELGEMPPLGETPERMHA